MKNFRVDVRFQMKAYSEEHVRDILKELLRVIENNTTLTSHLQTNRTLVLDTKDTTLE